MKNFTKILIVGAMSFPVLASAQVNVSTSVEPRNAVIEEWTGMYCGYCPIGAAEMDLAADNNPGRVVIVSMHAGGYSVPSGGDPDFRTPEGTIHDGSFPISGYPASTLNRRTIGGSQVYHPGNTNNADKVPAVLAENSEVNIYIEATVDVVTRQLDVDVEYYYTSNAPNPTNYLNVAILQNNVIGPQTDYSQPPFPGTYNPDAWVSPGNYRHGHMFRGFMTGQWGDPISTTTTGSTAIMSYSTVLPLNINGVPLDIAELEIAAYIGDGFESAGNVLTGSTINPTLTGLAANDEMIYISGNVPVTGSCNAGANITLSPEITIKNWGNNPLATATVTYDMNGGTPQVYNFSDVGNPIVSGASRTITLDPISFSALASNIMNVTVSDPNGVADNMSDNSGAVPFNVNVAAPTDNFITIDVLTDDKADEFYIEVRSFTGTLIWSEGNENVQGNYNTGNSGPTADPTNPLANNSSYSWQVNMPWITCYTVTVFDFFGDGMSTGTVGSYDIKDHTGTIVISESAANYGGSEESMVKVEAVALEELGVSDLKVYPNPASEQLNVDFNTKFDDIQVSIVDLLGRVIVTKLSSSDVSFDVSNLAKGAYVLTISTEQGTYTENVIID